MPNESEVAIIILAKDQASQIFGSVGKSAGKMGGSVEESAKGFQLLTKEQDKALKTMKPLGAAMVGLGAAGTALIATSTMVAARNEELALVLMTVGRNAGYSEDQLRDYENATKKMGITTSKARQSMVQMVQANISLAHSADLARLSQDAAVIAQMDSSEAFQHLITTIQRGDPIMARTLGLAVDFQGAYRDMANELGKSAIELTANEKIQARVNEVMKAGAGISGSYEAAMGAAGKQMRSLSRHTEELQAALGEHFLPMLGQGVQLVTDAVKAFNNLSDAEKDSAASALGMGSAAATATGTFVLLAPKVAATVQALTALGVSGLAVAPVLLAVAAAAAAMYKALEFSAKMHEHHADVSEAWASRLEEEAGAGKDATAIALDYADSIATIKQQLEDAPWYVTFFMDQQKILTEGMDEANAVFMKTADTYDEYVNATNIAAMATLKLAKNEKATIENGEIVVRAYSRFGDLLDEHTVKVARASQEEFDAAKVTDNLADSVDDAGDAAGEAADQFGELYTSAKQVGNAFTDGIPTMDEAYGLLLDTERAAGMTAEQIGELAIQMGLATEAEVEAQMAMQALVEQWAAGEISTEYLNHALAGLVEVVPAVDALAGSAEGAGGAMSGASGAGTAMAGAIAGAGSAALEATGYFGGLYSSAVDLGKAFEEGAPTQEDVYGMVLDTGRAAGLSAEEIGNMAVGMGVASEAEVYAQVAAANLVQAWDQGAISSNMLMIQTGKLDEAARLLEESARLEEEGQLAAAAAAEEQATQLIADVNATSKLNLELHTMRTTMPPATQGVEAFAAAGERAASAYGSAAAQAKAFREEASAAAAAAAGGVPSSGAPFRQYGGPVQAGQPYTVGERGPEMFVPFSSGTIVPNDRMVKQTNTTNWNAGAVQIHSSAPTASWQHSIEFAQMLA